VLRDGGWANGRTGHRDQNGRPEVSPALPGTPGGTDGTGLHRNRDDDTIVLGYSPHGREYRPIPTMWQPSTPIPRGEIEPVVVMCHAEAMVLAKMRKKLTVTVDELDKARLQDRYRGTEVVAIADAPLREPVRLAGEVQETRVVPRSGSSSVEVTIGDGTGRATVVFTGRSKVPGLKLGGGVLIEGVGRLERNRLTLLNPSYTLIAD